MKRIVTFCPTAARGLPPHQGNETGFAQRAGASVGPLLAPTVAVKDGSAAGVKITGEWEGGEERHSADGAQAHYRQQRYNWRLPDSCALQCPCLNRPKGTEGAYGFNCTFTDTSEALADRIPSDVSRRTK